MKKVTALQKNIDILETEKRSVLKELKNPIRKSNLGYQSLPNYILSLTERLQRIDNSISYLTVNYL